MSKKMKPDKDDLNRRQFLQVAGATSVAISAMPSVIHANDETQTASARTPETYVTQLYEKLTPEQKQVMCFDWDYQSPDKRRGLLRTHVSNNWQITDKTVEGFYTSEQQEIIRAIFEGLYNPEWLPKIDQQIKDDSKGYGKENSVAIFGEPGSEHFEFVMTGRHLTIRCDGNTQDHVAFGGPIFYGHAAQGFNEKPDHPGNVFWEQALAANRVYELLDGKQRKKALVARSPSESSVAFRANDNFPGIPVADMTGDQKEEVQKVLAKLIEPYRKADQQEAMQALKKQGGLDKCSLAFYASDDIGDDGVWDNWRLEGPSFVWYFRGNPHVHVWVNVADSAQVKTNAFG